MSILASALALASLSALAGPLENGGFEVAADGAPTGWNYGCSNDCQGRLAIDTDVKCEGGQSVRLESDSAHQSHRFCGLSQTLSPLLPDTDYRLTFRVKGEGVGVCWCGGGPGWRNRIGLPQGTFDWREVSFEFNPGEAESFEFRINVDSVTQALWIDDARLSPAIGDVGPLVHSVQSGEGAVVPLQGEKGIRVDGTFDDWSGQTFSLDGGDGRITARFRLGWSRKAFLVAVEATDAVPMDAAEEAMLWNYDSVQLAIDPMNEKTRGAYGLHDVEMDFGMIEGEPVLYVRCESAATAERLTKKTRFAIAHGTDLTVYEAAIPWKALGAPKPSPGVGFGFNVVVNDRDDGPDRVAAEWTSGVVIAKSPAEFKTLVISDGPWAYVTANPTEVVSEAYAKVTAALYMPEACDVSVSLQPLMEQVIHVEPGLTECVCYATAKDLEAGENVLDLTVTAGGKTYEARTVLVRSTADEDALMQIDVQEQRLPALKQALDAARAEGIPVFYPQADFLIAEEFCQYCRDDVAHGRYARAIEVADEVAAILDRAEAEVRQGVDVPVAKIDTISIRDGSFWAQCETGHGIEFRPVFLTGYGHFGPAIEATPLFNRIGINVIQFEMGPRSVVLADGGVDAAPIRDNVIAALDKSAANGVACCLLISPHYFPGWAFERWPDIQVDNGFLKNTLDAPQVREIYERYLRALIPLIKDHPALQSICLSNEPVSTGSPQDPYRLPLWHAYIAKVHGTIGTLNACYGTQHASFDDVPHPPFDFSSNLSAVYDAVRFNQERFAEWHAWMASIIHEMAPDVPCHAKVMALPSWRNTVFWGTDPWDFARLSQINGNDCYFMPFGNAPYKSNWLVQNQYYDLQRSMKTVPVFNTENHIIRDRESRHVDADHIYAAIWQGAIHGQGASTTWAWQRTYDETSDFEGLILHRPACTAAMSRCALDLMRLSREVAAIQNVAPKVALLYSHAATLRDAQYVGERSNAYEALNSCGVPIGFVTDEQVATGWLDRYDCLIVPGAAAASKGAIDGLRDYLAKGGRAIAIGSENLSTDEYGRDVAAVPFSATLKRAKGEELRDALAEELALASIEPQVGIRTPKGDLPFGVEWRSAECDGAVVVNAINYLSEAVQVRLPKGEWTDLITGVALPKTITLEPNVPVLARRS